MLGTGVRAGDKKVWQGSETISNKLVQATDFPLLKDMGAQLQLASRFPVLKDTLSQA